jgi:Fe2+ transport system protein FeoA
MFKNEIRLSDAPPNQYVVSRIHHSNIVKRKCMMMGIYEGIILKVVNNSNRMPTIIDVNSSRYSISKNIASKIFVISSYL